MQPGNAADLKDRSTGATKSDWLDLAGKSGAKDLAEEDLGAFKEELAAAQELLYATDSYALLVILQALDAAGKDGTIKHVMSGVNPQGCEVAGFKSPSAEELSHDFSGAARRSSPKRGRIGIFNRSYYEEVLVVRVHPAVLAAQHLAPDLARGDELWRQRYEDINAFERHLHRNGTRIVKLFLHVSKSGQKKRLLERLDDPAKHWKFSTADLAERALRRLHTGLRSDDHSDLNFLGTLVRRARRSQVRRKGASGGHPDPRHRAARSSSPRIGR